MTPRTENKAPFSKRSITTVEEIGAVIRAIRKENGLTQEEAALLCHVNARFLGELEKGKPKNFSLKLVLKVINTLGIVLVMQKRRL